MSDLPDRLDALVACYPKNGWGRYDADTFQNLDGIDIDEDLVSQKLEELQAKYNAEQYQRDRLAEYPSIQELVVALYDEEDKQAIIEKRAEIKEKYPKPEPT